MKKMESKKQTFNDLKQRRQMRPTEKRRANAEATSNITSSDQIVIPDTDLPRNLRDQQYDAVLIYAEADKKLALSLQFILERFIVLEDGKNVSVCVVDQGDDLSSDKLKYARLELAVKRSTLMLIFMSEHFMNNSWAQLQAQEYLQEALETKNTAIPVHVSKQNQNYTVPFGLRALLDVSLDHVFKEQKYVFGADIDLNSLQFEDLDVYFVRQMKELFNPRLSEKIIREKRQDEQKHAWILAEQDRRFQRGKNLSDVDEQSVQLMHTQSEPSGRLDRAPPLPIDPSAITHSSNDRAPPPPRVPPPPVAPSAITHSSESGLLKGKALKPGESIRLRKDSSGGNPNVESITAAALRAKARELLPTKRNVTEVTVTRSDVYKDESVQLDYFPLNVLNNLITPRQDQVVTHLNFAGIDQLTDFTFYALASANPCLYIKKVDLAGCFHLTDQGIKWLVKAFPNATEIVLNGCSKITEQSIYQMLKNCAKILYIHVKGTNVGNIHIPTDLSEIRISIHAAGCPVLTPPITKIDHQKQSIMSNNSYFCDLRDQNSYQLYKAIILTNESTTQYNLLGLLSGTESSTLQYVESLANYGPKNSNATFNITQCSQELADVYMSERTVYVLPYYATAKDQLMTTATSELVQNIIHILCQVPTAVFGFIPVMDSNSGDIQDYVLKCQNSVTTKLQKITKSINKLLISNVLKMQATAGDTSSLFYRDQDRLGRLACLCDSLTAAINDDEFVFFQTAVFPQDKAKRSENADVLGELLNSCKDKVEEKHPWFGRYSEHLIDLFRGIDILDTRPSSVKLQTCSESDFVQSLKTRYSDVMGKTASYYYKSLEYLHMLGIVVHVPTRVQNNGPTDYGLVSTNPARFAETLNRLLQQSSGVSLKVTTGETKNALQTLLAGFDKDTGNDALSILKNAGLLVNEESALCTPCIPMKSPPNPFFDTYLSTKVRDFILRHNLYKMRYEFPHLLPGTVFLQLAASAVVDCKIAWRDGVVLQNAPVEIMARLVQQFHASSAIEIVGQMPCKVTQPSLDRTLQNEVHKLALVLETILQRHGIGFVLKLEYNGKTANFDTDTIIGTTTGCEFNHENGKCSFCGITPREATIFWAMEALIQPTFSGEYDFYVGINTPAKQESLKTRDYVHGSKLLTRADEAYLVIEQSMDPVYFNSVQICFCFGGVGSNMRSIGVMHNKGLKDDGIKLEDDIQVGDTIRIDCSHVKESNEVQIDIYKNKDLTKSEKYPIGARLTPAIHSKKSMGQLTVLANKCPISSEPSMLLPGMRLEAKDRLNPSLCCVATVEKVLRDKIVIHFDGWTSRYDYTTTMNDENLHPVGWFDQRGMNHATFTQRLQPPKNRREHSWGKYLVEVKNWPVPYRLFNQKQTEGCGPYVVPNSVRTQLIGSSSDHCAAVLDRVGVMKTKLETVKREVTEEMYPALTTSTRYLPLAVLLPTEMTAEQVKTPHLDFFAEDKAMTVYSLCPYYNMPHFSEGRVRRARLDQKVALKAFSTISIVTLCYLSKTKNFMPDTVEKIFPSLQNCNMTYLEIQELLAVVFDMILMGLIMNDFNLSRFKQTVFTTLNKHIDGAKFFLKIPNNTAANDCLCPAHTMATDFLALGTDHLNLTAFEGYSNFIDQLILGENEERKQDVRDKDITEQTKLTSLPDGLFTRFPNLTYINLANHKISALPLGIGQCKKLKVVILSDNPLLTLPDDFIGCVETLEEIDISGTCFTEIPDVIFKAKNLLVLQANKTAIQELSRHIGELKKLQVLSLVSTGLTYLPDELGNCAELTHLRVSGIPWTHKTLLSLENMHQMYEENFLMAKLPKHEIDSLFRQLDAGDKGYLNEKEIAPLNAEIFKCWPRVQNDSNPELGNLPSCIMKLAKLDTLQLEYQGLTKIPDGLGELKELREISVAHNPLLESVSPELCKLEELKHLNLNGCPSLKTPPKEIVTKGFRAVMGYLRRLQIGSVACKRTKLMMVGLGGAGKTSLVECLLEETWRHPYSYVYGDDKPNQEITDGIDIVNWSVTHNDDTVTYSVWDFAGQSVYYNTHQFFLSNRAVYLLLWNIRLGYEHAGLDFWLSSIACHAPKAPILVIGSHVDQVQKYWLPKEEIQRKYPQIKGFHAISCLKGTGIAELQKNLLEVTLQEKYMGEKIPEAWLNFETKMTDHRKEAGKQKTESHTDGNLLQWKEVEECAVQCGIYEKSEIFQAVGFLHDLGAVQHFHNEFLRNIVVINPQWIVDAMACVVNVKESPIKDGRLFYKDLSKIWADYPENMLQWLLRLTEEFDLTFPIPDEKCNIVPCLLPAEHPPYRWSGIEEMPGFKETKMQYVFDYLPAGLFNRVQVRLYQFSDSSIIWKKGSKLTKNGHHALMTIVGEREVLVKVQGYRPENILFMVHEVFEGLIAMSFHGVKYDYSIPCNDCLKTGTHDPCMFTASKIRRATELKAPFLQCDKYFHTVTLTELHASMPPDIHSEFDLHLERSIHELDDLHDDLTFDVFMVYALGDIPGFGEEEKKVAPRRIYDDLTSNGFKVWFTADPSVIDLQAHALTMRSARVALICISDSFVATREMCDIFHYLKTNLQKTIQLVALGKTLQWQNSNIGMLISSDVFVKMLEPSRYEHKVNELVEVLRPKLSMYKDIGGPPPGVCFISYCWANSADAVKKGTRSVKGSVGWGDPRSFKDLLEKQGISCWLDVERVGQGGLFEDIADGLRQAKVILACVSDEYAKSNNCKLEFRFANATLKIPIVVAVVGTGQRWESTEVGMFSVGHPKVTFQHESTSALERLVAAIKGVLPEETDEQEEKRTPSVSDNNQQAFQELLELAQRKFQRQVATIADKMETSVNYPRIFVLDFLTEEEKGKINLKIATQLLEEKEEEERKQKLEEEQEEAEAKECGELEEAVAAFLEKKKQKEGGENAPKAAQNVSGAANLMELRGLGEELNTMKQQVVEGATKLHTDIQKKEQQVLEKMRPSLRPRSGLKKRSSTLTGAQAAMDMMSMIEDKQFEDISTDMEYCIRYLCEHERGWHCHGDMLPLPVMSQGEFDSFLDRAAPYMARLLAILKHAAVNLQIISSEKGAVLRRRMEEKCGLECDFTEEYEDLRNSVIQLDKELTRGSLKRCYLPSGKVLWLCAMHHQEDDRITVFSEDADDLYNDTYQKDNIQLDSLVSKVPNTKDADKARSGKDQSGNTGVKPEQTTPKIGDKKPTPRPLQRSATREAAAVKLKKSGNEAGVSAAAQAASGKTSSKACNLM